MNNEIEEKILEMLTENKEGAVTYKELEETINKIRGNMIQKLLDKEFEEHMKYKKGSHEAKKTTNRRNGKGSTKTLRTKKGEIEVTMPRDREGSFEPVVVPKKKINR